MRDRGSGWERHRVAVAIAATGLAATGATAAFLLAEAAGHGAARVKTVPLGTATVRRIDLVSVARYRGRLVYRSRETVHPSGSGTVTSLPRAGQILSRGSAAWAVDGQPVGVLYGSTPLFRVLRVSDTGAERLAVQSARADLLAARAVTGTSRGRLSGSARAARAAQARVAVAQARYRLRGALRALRGAQTPQRGPDVALVGANMAALGNAVASGDAWSSSLQDAVARWQRQLGADATGEIAPDAALVVPGAARVGTVHGHVGDPASAVTVALTAPGREAVFRIRGGVPAALATGRTVRILAAGRTARGRVWRVTPGRRSDTVVVAFAQSSPLARLSSTRAELSVTTADRRDVLVVPVQALVALASGGYALQLPGGRLLAVRTGTVRSDRIAVAGAGIHAGLRVVSVR